MYIEIHGIDDFKRQFGIIGRADAFTYDGFQALYQHFEDMDDGGWGARIVPADLCVLWTEYTYGEFLISYTQFTAEQIVAMLHNGIADRVKEVIADPAHDRQVFLMTTETVLVGTYE